MFLSPSTGIAFSFEDVASIEYQKEKGICHLGLINDEIHKYPKMTDIGWVNLINDIKNLHADKVLFLDNLIIVLQHVRCLHPTDDEIYVRFKVKCNYNIVKKNAQELLKQEFQRLSTLKNKDTQMDEIKNLLEVLVYAPGGPVAKSAEEHFLEGSKTV